MTENYEEELKKKLKKKEEELKMINENKDLKIRIFGFIKKRVTKVVEFPINKTLVISEYLMKIPKEKREFIKKIKESFPKGSEINIEVLK